MPLHFSIFYKGENIDLYELIYFSFANIQIGFPISLIKQYYNIKSTSNPYFYALLNNLDKIAMSFSYHFFLEITSRISLGRRGQLLHTTTHLWWDTIDTASARLPWPSFYATYNAMLIIETILIFILTISLSLWEDSCILKNLFKLDIASKTLY